MDNLGIKNIVVVIIISLSSVTSGVVMTVISPNFTLGKQAKELIEECESTLPRDQFCTLEAVKPGE